MEILGGEGGEDIGEVAGVGAVESWFLSEFIVESLNCCVCSELVVGC